MAKLRNLKPWLASKARTEPCTTITYHATAGSTLGGAISTLRAKGFSYHYIIEPNGQVWKCVPYTRVAFHAGASTGPEGKGVNAYSIGICFVGLNGPGWKPTDAQVASAIDITLQLMAAIPTIRWGTTHFGVSWGRKVDPRGFDLPGFCAEVGLEPWKMPKATWRLV